MTDVRKFGPLTVREQVIKGKATGKWFLEIPASLTSTGKRLRKLYKSSIEAEKLAKELNRKLAMRRLGFTEKSGKPPVPFAAAQERWAESMHYRAQAGEVRPSWMKTIRTRLKPLSAFFGSTDARIIKSDDISRYQAHRAQAGRKPVTVNGEVRVLRQILGWLLDDGAIERLPRFRRVPEVERREPPLTIEEVVRLLNCLPQNSRALVWVMAEAGLRPSEALSLPWDHVDTNACEVRVAPFDGWKPKTVASERVVPISRELAEAIAVLPRSGRYVFPGRKAGQPIQNIRGALATGVRKAGLLRNGKPLRVSVKAFRKAFATWHANERVHPRLLQEALGHAPGSQITNKHYVGVSDKELRKAMISIPVAPLDAAA